MELIDTSAHTGEDGVALESTFRFAAFAATHDSQAAREKPGTNYQVKNYISNSEEDKLRRTQVKEDIEQHLATCRFAKVFETDRARLQALSSPKFSSPAVKSAEEMMAKARAMALNRSEQKRKLEKEKQRQERVLAGLEVFKSNKEARRKQEEAQLEAREEANRSYRKQLNEYLASKAQKDLKELAAKKKESSDTLTSNT